MPLLEFVEVVLMEIPTAVPTVMQWRHMTGPVDLYEWDLGFDQPPRQQTTLTKPKAAVATADRRWFLFQVEDLTCFWRTDQVQRLLVKAIPVLDQPILFKMSL